MNPNDLMIGDLVVVLKGEYVGKFGIVVLPPGQHRAKHPQTKQIIEFYGIMIRPAENFFSDSLPKEFIWGSLSYFRLIEKTETRRITKWKDCIWSPEKLIGDSRND